jgi:hypothetical protein
MTHPQPTELPPLPAGEPYTVALGDLVARVNGFVYQGARTDAVLDTIKVLRANPELARQLLTEGPS